MNSMIFKQFDQQIYFLKYQNLHGFVNTTKVFFLVAHYKNGKTEALFFLYVGVDFSFIVYELLCIF